MISALRADRTSFIVPFRKPFIIPLIGVLIIDLINPFIAPCIIYLYMSCIHMCKRGVEVNDSENTKIAISRQIYNRKRSRLVHPNPPTATHLSKLLEKLGLIIKSLDTVNLMP